MSDIGKTDLPLEIFKRGKVRDVYSVDDKLLIISTDRFRKFISKFKARSQFYATDLSGLLIGFPSGSNNIAPDDGFNRKCFQFFCQDRSSCDFISKGFKFIHVLGFRVNDMIFKKVLCMVKPESGQLI